MKKIALVVFTLTAYNIVSYSQSSKFNTVATSQLPVSKRDFVTDVENYKKLLKKSNSALAQAMLERLKTNMDAALESTLNNYMSAIKAGDKTEEYRYAQLLSTQRGICATFSTSNVRTDADIKHATSVLMSFSDTIQ